MRGLDPIIEDMREAVTHTPGKAKFPSSSYPAVTDCQADQCQVRV
ncbi:MAG: hypothetical protein R3F37_14575 [Candidatus Competibacteraceae bacterium]